MRIVRLITVGAFLLSIAIAEGEVPFRVAGQQYHHRHHYPERRSYPIVLEPVLKSSTESNPFDWLLNVISKVVDPTGKHQQRPTPPPALPVIGPISLPGRGGQIYIRQLDNHLLPWEKKSRVIIKMVTRDPLIDAPIDEPILHHPYPNEGQAGSVTPQSRDEPMSRHYDQRARTNRQSGSVKREESVKWRGRWSPNANFRPYTPHRPYESRGFYRGSAMPGDRGRNDDHRPNHRFNDFEDDNKRHRGSPDPDAESTNENDKEDRRSLDSSHRDAPRGFHQESGASMANNYFNEPFYSRAPVEGRSISSQHNNVTTDHGVGGDRYGNNEPYSNTDSFSAMGSMRQPQLTRNDRMVSHNNRFNSHDHYDYRNNYHHFNNNDNNKNVYSNNYHHVNNNDNNNNFYRYKNDNRNERYRSGSWSGTPYNSAQTYRQGPRMEKFQMQDVRDGMEVIDPPSFKASDGGKDERNPPEDKRDRKEPIESSKSVEKEKPQADEDSKRAALDTKEVSPGQFNNNDNNKNLYRNNYHHIDNNDNNNNFYRNKNDNRNERYRSGSWSGTPYNSAQSYRRGPRMEKFQLEDVRGGMEVIDSPNLKASDEGKDERNSPEDKRDRKEPIESSKRVEKNEPQADENSKRAAVDTRKVSPGRVARPSGPEETNGEKDPDDSEFERGPSVSQTRLITYKVMDRSARRGESNVTIDNRLGRAAMSSEEGDKESSENSRDRPIEGKAAGTNSTERGSRWRFQEGRKPTRIVKAIYRRRPVDAPDPDLPNNSTELSQEWRDEDVAPLEGSNVSTESSGATR